MEGFLLSHDYSKNSHFSQVDLEKRYKEIYKNLYSLKDSIHLAQEILTWKKPLSSLILYIGIHSIFYCVSIGVGGGVSILRLVSVLLLYDILRRLKLRLTSRKPCDPVVVSLDQALLESSNQHSYGSLISYSHFSLLLAQEWMWIDASLVRLRMRVSGNPRIWLPLILIFTGILIAEMARFIPGIVFSYAVVISVTVYPFIRCYHSFALWPFTLHLCKEVYRSFIYIIKKIGYLFAFTLCPFTHHSCKEVYRSSIYIIQRIGHLYVFIYGKKKTFSRKLAALKEKCYRSINEYKKAIQGVLRALDTEIAGNKTTDTEKVTDTQRVSKLNITLKTTRSNVEEAQTVSNYKSIDTFSNIQRVTTETENVPSNCRPKKSRGSHSVKTQSAAESTDSVTVGIQRKVNQKTSRSKTTPNITTSSAEEVEIQGDKPLDTWGTTVDPRRPIVHTQKATTDSLQVSGPLIAKKNTRYEDTGRDKRSSLLATHADTHGLSKDTQRTTIDNWRPRATKSKITQVPTTFQPLKTATGSAYTQKGKRSTDTIESHLAKGVSTYTTRSTNISTDTQRATIAIDNSRVSEPRHTLTKMPKSSRSQSLDAPISTRYVDTQRVTIDNWRPRATESKITPPTTFQSLKTATASAYTQKGKRSTDVGYAVGNHLAEGVTTTRSTSTGKAATDTKRATIAIDNLRVSEPRHTLTKKPKSSRSQSLDAHISTRYVDTQRAKIKIDSSVQGGHSKQSHDIYANPARKDMDYSYSRAKPKTLRHDQMSTTGWTASSSHSMTLPMLKLIFMPADYKELKNVDILKSMHDVKEFLKQFPILKVIKITENPSAMPPNGALFQKFQSAWKQLPSNSGQRNTILAFHGTAEGNIQSICNNGYDPSKRKRQAHGDGEYFAVSPDIPLGYCRDGKKILLNELLLGQHGIHHTRQGDIVVMKNPAHDLPRFIIEFQ